MRFLKAQNPLYCAIDQWCEEAIANDDNDQSDETMDTESDQPETENEPMECSSDELSLALHKLKVLALRNNFTIYDVAIVCLVLYLQTSDVCNVDSSELRQMVASHMEANAASYSCFVCQPVATDNEYNADTELKMST